MTKLFHVKIRAYGYKAEFDIEAEDSPESIENSILDKIGQNRVLFENAEGWYAKSKLWLTYEEVVDGSRSRPLQQEEVVRT